jgi:DUF1680 family protein
MHSRRRFLGATAAAIGVWGQAKENGREKLFEFPYSAVSLTGGPLKDHYERTLSHFLSLDNDRLLKVYRQRAGLPAPGEDMGGWYDADGFVPGHTIGQYISGLARMYGTTNHPAARAKVDALVRGFGQTLGPGGYPYASEKGAIAWPCYILDKYEIGMLDAARIANVVEARELLPRVIRGAMKSIPDHTYDRTPNSPKQAPYDEPYILPENLFEAWELTGDRQFHEMGKLYLLNSEYFDPLAQGRNVLPGKHAYSHVIALSSAAKAYQVSGERRYLDAIRNAWDMLEQTQQYASGGWGPKETFVVPHEGKLAESLSTTTAHFETPCGSYAQTKLARYLLRFTGESRYADGLERVIWNTVLASLDPGADGEYFYYSHYQPNATKDYYHRKWPCCSGTLVQGVADYVVSAYFHGPESLYVALFTPSEVRWNTNGTPIKLIQSTNYPDSEAVTFRIETPKPAPFSLNVRIPAWISGPARFSINGKAHDVAAAKSTFASIRRTWKNHDVVEVWLPFGFRTEAIDDRNPNVAAVMQGPRMMVATNAPGDSASMGVDLPGAMKAAGGSSYVLPLGDRAPLTFRPYHAVRGESTTTYFRLSKSK